MILINEPNFTQPRIKSLEEELKMIGSMATNDNQQRQRVDMDFKEHRTRLENIYQQKSQ